MNGVSVDSTGRSGGLALLWRKDIQVSLRNYSTRFIDIDYIIQDTSIRVTVTYGEPNVSLRRNFWNFFKSIKSDARIPWISFGDFNEVMTQAKFCGRGPRAEWQIHHFREALSHCGLSNMGYKGSRFTWQHLSVYLFTQQARLDRCVGNESLTSLFPWHSIEHIPTISSDHQALFIKLHTKSPSSFRQQRKNPFRFEACWIKKNCEKIIEANWYSDSNSLRDN
ncbi:hypothetical protein DH2020_004714 [Rehmannia glutinosa]|uniref:Endonuclease/exonuclease/phosphatase domain-containing protein n=1 Tax=Rehmannia glutinosa TaxID=99300 RepID=A0ABR0XQD4_REHGL